MTTTDSTFGRLISDETPTMGRRRHWSLGGGIPIAVILGGVGAFFLFDHIQQVFPGNSFIVAFGVFMSVILALAPLLISFAHAIARNRQLSRLESLGALPIAESSWYKIAIAALRSIDPAVLKSRYFAGPILAFGSALLLGWLLIFLAPLLLLKQPGDVTQVLQGVFDHRSALLGGLNGLKMSSTDLSVYQSKTFTVIGMAFVGSYVYIIGRLLDRVNNNDVYPISYYFYLQRIIVACLVADIFWLTLGVFDVAEDLAVLVGFVIGFSQPDLFLVLFTRRVFQALKFRGDQNDPDPDALPTNLNLLMIEGLSRNHADRLLELGIDNAEVLATQNPFLMLARTPYELALIVKWVGQAQLYLRAKEKGTKALRAAGINEISDLQIALRDDSAKGGVAAALGIPEASLGALAQAIEADPTYIRLADLRARLK